MFVPRLFTTICQGYSLPTAGIAGFFIFLLGGSVYIGGPREQPDNVTGFPGVGEEQ